MVLGLTGKYCSGKNLAAEVFVSRGWYEIDMDRFGHDALIKQSARIIKDFGPDILSEDGSIDRKKLGIIVFNNKLHLQHLESIIHPDMVKRCKEEIKSKKDRNIIINAAILHHMELNKLCDSVLWIKSNFPIRITRALTRDKIPIISILKRIYGQRKLDAKYWVEDVDIYSIQNNDNKIDLETEVNSLIDKFEERV